MWRTFSAYKRWLINAWDTESYFKQKLNLPQPATEVTSVYTGSRDVHNTLYGFWSSPSLLSFGTMKGKIRGMPRHTGTAALWFFIQFFAVLFRILSSPWWDHIIPLYVTTFQSPSALIRGRVLMEPPGSTLLLGSRISLVPLNNEIDGVPSVLIKTHGHSSI